MGTAERLQAQNGTGWRGTKVPGEVGSEPAGKDTISWLVVTATIRLETCRHESHAASFGDWTTL